MVYSNLFSLRLFEGSMVWVGGIRVTRNLTFCSSFYSMLFWIIVGPVEETLLDPNLVSQRAMSCTNTSNLIWLDLFVFAVPENLVELCEVEREELKR